MPHLVLKTHVDAITQAVQFAEEAAREACFPEETSDRLVLSVGEAVANAIEHGNALEEERTVTVSWRIEGDGIWFGIQDEGAGIAHESIENATLPEDILQTGGRGLYIIRELSDAFVVSEDGTTLTLLFRPRMLEADSSS